MAAGIKMAAVIQQPMRCLGFHIPCLRVKMYPNNHNPFADDDEEQDTPAATGLNFTDCDKEENTINPAIRRQRQLEQEVMRSAQSAMDSSSRSLGLIYESEKMGTETAEELIRQGGVLKRTERLVDNMAQDIKTSQKHINTIKSFWGGFVNYFKGNSEVNPPQKEQPPVYEASNRLQNALAESKEHAGKYEASHPNVRKLDTSDEMSEGLSRLKSLGMGLQAEIDDQDVSVDSLLNKMDSMENKISSTNRQLKNLK
ncbi:Synaptosomal-associated protein 29 [Bagarius yarrelli]|uniref:Synaptosomal-associated protein 29 n=1 Tax=Bagarius yarrelli TaxID=175774 RepID=A0A556V9F6_BAGYA|nr:Synaptosomal-associated protein 29 [Bagarius yarrelli]